MILVGSRVRITPEAWKKFQVELGRELSDPGVQIVTNMPAHPPYHDKYLLTWPFQWWNVEDLEEVDETP